MPQKKILKAAFNGIDDEMVMVVVVEAEDVLEGRTGEVVHKSEL